MNRTNHLPTAAPPSGLAGRLLPEGLRSLALPLAGFAVAATMAALPALAQDAPGAEAAATVTTTPTPTPDKGDTAWMLVATVLVLLMIVPGLALFYGGLVRTKNMLSVLMQVFTICALGSVLWCVLGYSMAFTDGGSLNSFVGGFSKVFLKGVDATTLAATFSNGVYIPELVYMCFQMTFAAITPALIIGAFAERVKFSSLILFVIGWSILAYYPIAHMVWYWGGPDTIAAAATAKDDVALHANGLIFEWGALDFAGGTVVHINAGIAGLVGALIIGPRLGYRRDVMAPHSMTMTMIGAGLLWVGWFGFNAGSNLESNGVAALAMANTFTATAAAGLSWTLIEWIVKGKPSLLGMVSGVVAGLVAVTPASGWGGPMGCLVLGLVAGVVCFFFCTTVKSALKYDDSLDVFGVHCIGGILGALATGILVDPNLGGAGIPDYTTQPGTLLVGTYDMATQLIAQAKAVGLTLVWSGLVSAVLFFILKLTLGVRVTEEQEREGLDVTIHGEAAYHY